MDNKKKNQETRVKSPIKLRFKKLSNGNKSIYFAHWDGNKWQYEFLKDMYIVSEKTSADKEANKETLRLAQAIQAKKIVELQNTVHGFSVEKTRSNINVLSYIKKIIDGKKTHSSKKGYHSLMVILTKYAGKEVTFKDVDVKFCEEFINYIKKAKTKTGSIIAPNTQRNYFSLLKCILNSAINDGIINNNPTTRLKKNILPKKQETNICYLTANELKQIEATNGICKKVKQAFLFSCYTGLRFSDIKNLRWENVTTRDDGKMYIDYRQQKTGKVETLPLAQKAVELLPDKGTEKLTDNVFNFGNNVYSNTELKLLSALSGINKKITFHVARHTYATLLLTLEVPIETVSKNLGHSDIHTTQIYAKVMAQKQRAAVDLLDTL